MMTLTDRAAERGTIGALNALANYWIKKAGYDNVNEELLVPELNLERGAGAAFHEFLMGQMVDASVAFETGLAVAAILLANPLDAGGAISELLHRTVEGDAEARRP